MVQKKHLEQHPQGGQLNPHHHHTEGDHGIHLGVGEFWGRVVTPPRKTLGHPLSVSSPRAFEGGRALDTLQTLQQDDFSAFHGVNPRIHWEGVHG